MNDHISKCGNHGLRAATGLVAALALAGTARAQATALTINGQTATNNNLTLNATVGSTMTIKVDNIAQPNRPYGLFLALAHNANTTGWYLQVDGGGKKPMPVATGVGTAVVEGQFGTDISPDRPSNPNLKLDAGGHLTLSFLVPNSVSGATFYFQAVVLKTGSTTQTDFSNAIAVTFGAPTTAARAVISLATTGIPIVDHAGFGVLEFTNGTPSSGTYTADATLLDIKVDNIAMGDMHPWALHSVNGIVSNRRPRDFDWQSARIPALNVDNYEYGRVELPPLPGNDGTLGTSDDIPARVVMRCYDNLGTSQEGFFLIVNKGENPNSPGQDFYVIGRKKDSLSPGTNSWKVSTAFSPDGSRMSAIYDDTSNSINPQMFLIATDCSKPFTDGSGNPTDIVDVSPTNSKNFFVKGQIFTTNRLWFTRDTGTNTPRELYGVNIRATQPVPQLVVIPTNPNYTSPQVDQIPDKAFVVSPGGGSTLCFVAGDVFVTGTTAPPTPDAVDNGDWYAVTELKPTQAVNLTQFPQMTPPVRTYTAGDAYNGQSGYASLSPDGSQLALTAFHANETPQTEEVYIYTTKDANNDNAGDDAGSARFNNPVSNSGNFSHTAGLKKTADLYMADNDHLFFYYGTWTSTVAKDMDLFSWNNATKVIANVTRTGGTSFPITTKGTVYPEGYFVSPNGKYMIFSRGFSNPGTKTNLVAVDVATGKLINITGDEFAGAKTSNTSNPGLAGENFDWHLSLAGGLYPSLCYFAIPIDGASGSPRNPWVFDANFPSTAIQLTTDSTSTQIVEALTPSPVTLGCAWFWGITVGINPPSVNADMQYQDLLYYFRDDLSETAKTGTMSLGNFVWLRPGTSADTTGPSPASLVAVFGDDATILDNAKDGKVYYFSLNGTTNYKFNQTTGADAPGHQIGSTSGIINIFAVRKP